MLDNNPHSIESPQKLYIQYSYDISFDYSTGRYPDGEEEEWIWEDKYIPITHSVNGLSIGRHEWMRIKIGEIGNWTYPIRISANVTNINSISSEVIIEEISYTSFKIILEFEDGSTKESDPILIRNGKDGTEITNAEIRIDGNLYITYSDGTIVNVGRARGIDGEGIPPAQDDDYVLSQSGGIAIWISALQVLNNALSATSPIEYDFNTGILSHSNDDGYRHLPIGGDPGDLLSTDGAGNYTWEDPLVGYIQTDGTNSNIGVLQYNTTYTVTGSEPNGSTYWDANNNTLSTVLGNGVIGQQFEELFFNIRNTTGDVLLNGYVAMYTGVIGGSGKITANYGIADGSVPSIYNIGIFTEDISNNANGMVTTYGNVNMINTTGSTFGETWSDGDILYVSPTTPGYLTKVKPNSPDLVIIMATVVFAHLTQGILLVKPVYNSKLIDLDDVNGTPLTTSGQLPLWDQSNGFFDFNYNLLQTFSETSHLTGFIDPDNITVEYNYTNRTITLTGDLTYYYRGIRKELTSPWTSSAHTATNNTWYLYSSDGDTFTWSTTVWQFKDIMVSMVIRKSTEAESFALRECHGLMDVEAHNEAHDNIGTYRKSGGLVTSGTYTLNTATDSATTPGFDAAIIKDEDLKSNILAWIEGTYTTIYVSPGNILSFNTTSTFPFLSSGSYIQYNNVIAGTLVTGTTNKYYNIYQILVPTTNDAASLKYRTLLLQAQVEYSSLSAAISEDIRGLNIGDLTSILSEFIFFTRLTYVTSAGDANTGKCRLINISYLEGSKASQVSITGFTTNNHSNLSNLNWTDSMHIGTANTLAAFNSSGSAIEYSDVFIMGVAISSKDIDLEADTDVGYFPILENMTFVTAFINVTIAPVGSNAIWDINVNGTTVLSTKITIEAGEYTSLEATSQPVFSTSTATQGQRASVDCDQIGATTPGQNAILVLIYRKN